MPTAFPKTTSETLKHKINPSAGETLPHAVDVLLYTPGEGPACLLLLFPALGDFGFVFEVSPEVKGDGT